MQNIGSTYNDGISKKIGFRFWFVFLLLCMASIPFKRYLLPDMGKHIQWVWQPLIRFSAKYIFSIKGSYTVAIESDSTGMYIHFFNVFVLSVVLTVIWWLVDKQKKQYAHLHYYLVVMCSYYLALQLLVYGCSKLFLWQFYLPEPNTLFTTVGDTYKDLLFWSTMGVAPSYSIFSAIIEIVPAMLLLFKRTRIWGACIASMVMLQVLVLNISFDISVKVYALFLLLLCLYIAKPVIAFVVKLIVYKKAETQYLQPIGFLPKKMYGYIIIKALIITCIIAEVLYPYIATQNFNDAKADRTALYGAYHVTTFIRNTDTLAPLTTDTYRWRRVFVHSKGYFIAQYMNDAMQDYTMQTDTIAKKITIQHTQDSTVSIFNYNKVNDSVLLLSGTLKADTVQLYLQKIDLSKLAAMQNEFHFTMDE